MYLTMQFTEKQTICNLKKTLGLSFEQGLRGDNPLNPLLPQIPRPSQEVLDKGKQWRIAYLNNLVQRLNSSLQRGF